MDKQASLLEISGSDRETWFALADAQRVYDLSLRLLSVKVWFKEPEIE